MEHLGGARPAEPRVRFQSGVDGLRRHAVHGEKAEVPDLPDGAAVRGISAQSRERDSVPERIVVVAAVIERDGRFLVARRLKGTHLAGYWEFPGGKVHDGETQEDALQREIAEELNTGISKVRKIFHTAHAYPERIVELHFYRGELTGEPQPVLGQELRWITRDEFARAGVSARRRGAN